MINFNKFNQTSGFFGVFWVFFDTKSNFLVFGKENSHLTDFFEETFKNKIFEFQPSRAFKINFHS